VAKASTELVKGEQTSLVKSKLFGRLTRKFGDLPFYGQASISAGHITRLHTGNLKVNDAFYLPNFKGIRNLGYHFDTESKKKGLGGDILGFDRYAMLNLKVSQISCPLLVVMNVEPFAFCNFALVPNR
jgi:hypothetical protein